MLTARPSRRSEYWLNICRSFGDFDDFVKVADLGGDGQDIPFEQAFSNLAHAYIKDKAPGLLDYEVGFQLVDRAEDNKKAVGVFGFKVGSSWLYAPVFFLSGDLKGHELLYIKNQDSFVPLKENWINYLLNKKPLSFGEGVQRNTRELGVQSPDFSQFVHSPASKNAAARARKIGPDEAFAMKREAEAIIKQAEHVLDRDAFHDFRIMPDWSKIAVHTLSVASANHPDFMEKYKGLATFPQVLKEAGFGGVKSVIDMTEAHPRLADALDNFYDPGMIQEAVSYIKAAAARRSSVLDFDSPEPSSTYRVKRRPNPHTGSVLDVREHPIKTGALHVVTYDPGVESNLPSTITDEDYDKLLKEEVLVKDTRDEEDISVPFKTETTRELVNPSESGLYDVMTGVNEFKKMVVILGPHGPFGRKDFATVISTEDPNGWINIHPSYVWASKAYDAKDWKDWAAGLPNADEKTLSEDKEYILVSDGKPDGTLPFVVQGGDGSYSVRFDLYSERPRPAYMKGQTNKRHIAIAITNDDEKYDRWTNGERVHTGIKRGATIRSNYGDVFIPNGWRVFEVQKPDYADDQWDAPELDPSDDTKRIVSSLTGGKGSSEDAPVSAANIVDVELGIWQKTAALADRLTISHTGTRFLIDGTPFREKQAFVHLIRDKGFTEPVARHLLKDSKDGLHKLGGAKREYLVAYANWVKAAAGEDPRLLGGPQAPGFPDENSGNDGFMGSGMNTQFPQAEHLPVSDMQPDQSEAQEAYSPHAPDPMAAQTASQAAQTGQREIFDTAMVGSLLKTTRDDLLVDKHLGDLMKGLDKTGRLLFLLYWHQEEFADRYGKESVPELEDSLRNTFESLGDLVLFLKQKTIDAKGDAHSAIDLKSHADA